MPKILIKGAYCMRIMTSNIWGNYFNNPPIERADGLIYTYDKYNPDVIGFQEVKDDWYETDLFKHLSKNYRFIATEIFYKDNDRHTPIAYKKDLKVIASGLEYLKTDWEDLSKAITWVVLEKPNNDGRFAVCNTHFWWPIGEKHDNIRTENAIQMVNLAKFIQSKYFCPVFMIGDMNTKISSDAFKVYKENGVVNTYDVAKEKKDVSSLHGDPVRNSEGVLKGKTTTDDHTFSIDHILMIDNSLSVSKYFVVEDQQTLDSTDHSPVFIDVEI